MQHVTVLRVTDGLAWERRVSIRRRGLQSDETLIVSSCAEVTRFYQCDLRTWSNRYVSEQPETTRTLMFHSGSNS